jgi:hypothetical protein
MSQQRPDQILPRSTVFLPAAIDPSGGGSTGDLTPAAALMPRLAEGYDSAGLWSVLPSDLTS